MRPLSFLSPAVRPGRPGLTIFLPLAAGLLASAGCGGRVYVVSSLGPPHTITVDGRTDDWNGALSFVEKQHLFLGFVNDRDKLYVCVTREQLEDRAAGAPMGGLTIWFDPKGGEARALGIRLPGPGGPPEGEGPGRQPDEEQGGENPRPGRDRNGEGPQPPGGGAIEILGPNGQTLDKLTPEEAAEAGLEIRQGVSSGAFSVEIGIPLRADEKRRYAVGVEPDGTVGIGFFSAPPSRPGGRRNGPPGGGPGEDGGMPGGIGGGMGPGGMGGTMRSGGAMPPDMDPDVTRGFKIWTRVKLANSAWPRPSGVSF